MSMTNEKTWTALPTSLTIVGLVSLLVISAFLLITAPFFIADGYSVIIHSISESAAQGLKNAWIARLGFLCFGFSVIWLAICLRGIWVPAVWISQLGFGVMMTAAAAFSHKPWLVEVPADLFEDLLHSVAAGGMGLAFTIGVISRMIQRPNDDWRSKVFDAFTAGIAVGIPLATTVWIDIAGMLQRMMFAVSYVWFIREVFFLRRRGAVSA